VAERVECERLDVCVVRLGGFAAVVLKGQAQRVMLARLRRRAMMRQWGNLKVPLLSARKGPSGGLSLRNDQSRGQGVQGAMPGLCEAKCQ
jgi:hypothetical protein